METIYLVAILVILYGLYTREMFTANPNCVIGSGSDAVCDKGCDWIDQATRWNGEAGTATICQCNYCRDCEYVDGRCKKREYEFESYWDSFGDDTTTTTAVATPAATQSWWEWAFG